MASSGKLHVLRNPVDSLEQVVDIVLVGGIGTKAPTKWPVTEQGWLNDLPASGRGVRLLSYEYSSPFTGAKTSWESLLVLGYDFLDRISATPPVSDAVDRPIMIIAHSLGGILVKQALCVANVQFARYGSIMNAIVGLVLLSTPHRFTGTGSTFAGCKDILDATSRKSHKFPTVSVEQEDTILLDLADRFENLSFRTPVLSVYELRETKVSATLRSKYQQLVGREECSTGAPMETLIGLNLDHNETCCFNGSASTESINELNRYFKETISNASSLVRLRLEDQEFQYATMSTYSPTMSEMPLHDDIVDSNDWPSNQTTEWTSTNKTLSGASTSGFELVPSATPPVDAPDTVRPVNLPCHLLSTHSTNHDFCGREDMLQQIALELLPSKSSVTASRTSLRQFALCGFGGIGKTEIAREFARRHKSAFDAVFWILADEISKLDHHYQQISLALGLETSSECKSHVVSRELVKGWLSQPRKKLSYGAGNFKGLDQPDHGSAAEASWLLIFDNADDPMILADYWPQGSGSVLLTSRDPLAKTMFTRRPSGTDLGPLTPEDSLTLLGHLTTTIDESERDSARQISEAFGGIPLAISQMASIIRRQDLTLEEFLELWTDHEEHGGLYDTKFDTNLIPYRHSLSTVWAFEKLKPHARRLLELVAFLDPDTIGEDLLTEASIQIISSQCQHQFKKSNYIDARADLLQSSLIQRDKQQREITVHRVVQDTILATMDSTQKCGMFEQVVRVLWANWPSAMPKPSKPPVLPQPKSTGGRLHVERWPTCAAVYPHVLRLHQLWPSLCGQSSESTKLHFAKLLTESAWYQKERGRTRGFDGFFETALSICKSSNHPDRNSLLADVYFCLGAIAMDSSDFDASRGYKEKSHDLVRKICDELGGVEDDRLYLAYAERGISRIQDKRYAEGEADLKEAIRMRRSSKNYVPRSGEANLSWALLAQGKLDECNELLLESLAGRERALGKNDRESVRTGLILYALGNLRAVQNSWAESLEYHKRAWLHMRATVGDRDFYTANASIKMAEHLIRLGQKDEAMNIINLALEVWSVDTDSHVPEIARATFLKGKLFEATKKPQKASISLRVACRMRNKITQDDKQITELSIADFTQIVPFWAQ